MRFSWTSLGLFGRLAVLAAAVVLGVGGAGGCTDTHGCPTCDPTGVACDQAAPACYETDCRTSAGAAVRCESGQWVCEPGTRSALSCGGADADADGDVGDEADAPGEADGTGDDGGPPADPLGRATLEEIVTRLAADEMGGRDEGTSGWTAARDYLITWLERCALVPAGTDGYEQPIAGGDGINLLARVPGADPGSAERHVILGAHYDHLGDCAGGICNGAYDNATAVAAALGVGCALRAEPPPHSVLIALWDSEEPPAFLTDEMGSQYYAAHPTVPLDQTDVALALDLIGEGLWAGFDGHFVLGAELSPGVAAVVEATAVPAGLEVYRMGLHLAEEQPLGHQPWSDYDAFRNLGLPVLFLSDGQNRRYHQPDDETASVDFERLVAETRFLHDLVSGLASVAAAPAFESDGADYRGDAETIGIVGTAALAAGGMADSLAISTAARGALTADFAAAAEVRTALEGGATPTPAQIQALRTAVQRMMCLAGSLYPESVCLLF